MTIASTAGCLGFLTGEEAYEAAADPAAVDEAAAADTGYELDGVEDETIEETFEIAGQERTVRATNYVATYEKTIELPVVGEADMGVFAVIASPAFEIAGRTLNPIDDHDNAELAQLLASEYEQLEVRGEAETISYEPLGESLETSKLDGAARFGGQEIDVYVQVGSFQHEDDFLVPMAVYPQKLATDEEPEIETLTEAIDHPADV